VIEGGKRLFSPIEQVTNPKSIHGMYPYRGKMSAIEAANIISKLSNRTTLLDPFCGSGTIVYEAAKVGLKAIGIDANPLAGWLTEAKLQCPSSLSDVLEEWDNLKLRGKTKRSKFDDNSSRFYFHDDSWLQIASTAQYFESMSPYLKGVFCGAIALTARGCNQYAWTSSTVGKNMEPKLFIDFFEKVEAKLKKHHYPMDQQLTSRFIGEDSRNLNNFIPSNSVDVVFTSPPYFDALDYTAYYAKIVYGVLGIESSSVKQVLMQKMISYESDMQCVLDAILDVTNDDALIVFVVGDKKTRKGIINGGEFFSSLLHHDPTEIIERHYTGSSSQVFDKINKTSRKEQIVVWDKSKW
jgi:16S rRNA G966 N2-methylase RsmD